LEKYIAANNRPSLNTIADEASKVLPDRPS